LAAAYREGIFMLTLRITAWNYTPYQIAGELPPNTDQVFDMTLDDQEVVSGLYEHFNQLRRDIRAGHVMLAGYRYRFMFTEDGHSTQVYTGATCSPAWAAYTSPTDNGRRPRSVPEPGAILHSLHDSIGLPIFWQGKLLT
jgi:hypothetical protein